MHYVSFTAFQVKSGTCYKHHLDERENKNRTQGHCKFSNNYSSLYKVIHANLEYFLDELCSF